MTDWQSYLDGSMPAEDKQHLDTHLPESDELQRDLAGFKAFQLGIRHAGYGIESPQMILEEMLVKVAGTKPPKGNRIYPKLALAAAFVVVLVCAFLFLGKDPMNFATTSVRESVAISSEIEAAAWVFDKTTLEAPILTLKSDGGKLKKAMFGDGWGAYIFEVGGSEVKLAMGPDDDFDEHGTTQQLQGMPLLYRGKGIGWRGGKRLSFYLTGPTEVCEIVLRSFCDQTYKAVEGGAAAPMGHGKTRAKMTR